MEALEVHDGEDSQARSSGKRKLLSLGCLARVVLGCGALLFGAGIGLMLIAPTVLSSSTTMAEDALERMYRGHFTIEAMDLNWFSEQSVKNLEVRDPDGERVGLFNLQMPSLWTLIAEDNELGPFEVHFDASLSVDATGVSNLERAFESRETVNERRLELERRNRDWDSRRRGLREQYGDLSAQVVLGPSRLVFEERAGGGSRRIEIEGLEGRLRVDRGQRIELSLAGTWGPAPPPDPESGSAPAAPPGPSTGGLSIDATLENPFSGSDSVAPMAVDATFEVRELPTALFDVAGEGTSLRETVGDTLSGRAEIRGTLQVGTFGISAGGELASVSLEGTLDRGMLMATGGDLDFRLPRTLVDRIAAAISARAVDPSPPVLLAIEELTLSLGPWLDEVIDPERTRTAEPWRELLRGASIRIAGEAGDWRVGEEPEARRVAVSLFGAPMGDDCSLSLGLVREPFEISVRAERAVALLEALGGAEGAEGAQVAATLQASVAGLPSAGVVSAELASILGDVIEADLEVVLSRPEGADLNADGFLELRSADSPRRVEFRASVPDPAAEGAFGAPPLTATIYLPGATAEVLLAFAELPPPCGYLVGEGVRIEWDEGRRGEFRVEARSESFGLEVGGRFDDQGFSAEGPVRISVVADGALVDCVLGELAGGAQLRPLTEGELVHFSLEELELPALGDAPFDLARFLAGASATISGSLPDLVFTQSGETATFRGVELEGELSPGEPVALRVAAQLEGQPEDGFIQIALAIDPRPGEDPAYVTSIDGSWAGIPTSVADAALAQEGLLLDALGPRLEGSVSGEFPGAEPIHLVLDSDLAHLDLDASVGPGLLSSRGERGIDASVGLTPLVLERVVSPLLPLLVDLGKPDGAEPVGISLRDFDLPLDGDLSALNGRLDLDLGEITYRLFPGLDPILSLGGLKQEMRLERIPPIAIRIERGVAHYDGLPIEIGGSSYLFRGSYDLARSELDLATSVPLRVLGKDVSRALDKARDFLGPETEVPIRLSGTWSRPRIRIEESFLSTLTENALQGALRRLLQKDD